MCVWLCVYSLSRRNLATLKLVNLISYLSVNGTQPNSGVSPAEVSKRRTQLQVPNLDEIFVLELKRLGWRKAFTPRRNKKTKESKSTPPKLCIIPSLRRFALLEVHRIHQGRGEGEKKIRKVQSIEIPLRLVLVLPRGQSFSPYLSPPRRLYLLSGGGEIWPRPRRGEVSPLPPISRRFRPNLGRM